MKTVLNVHVQLLGGTAFEHISDFYVRTAKVLRRLLGYAGLTRALLICYYVIRNIQAKSSV